MISSHIGGWRLPAFTDKRTLRLAIQVEAELLQAIVGGRAMARWARANAGAVAVASIVVVAIALAEPQASLPELQVFNLSGG